MPGYADRLREARLPDGQGNENSNTPRSEANSRYKALTDLLEAPETRCSTHQDPAGTTAALQGEQRTVHDPVSLAGERWRSRSVRHC